MKQIIDIDLLTGGNPEYKANLIAFCKVLGLPLPNTPIERVSVYLPPISNVKPAFSGTIRNIAELVKGYYTSAGEVDPLTELTHQLRKLAGSEKRKYKCKNLPFVTFGGVFSQRRANGLIEPSGLICVDLDHVTTRTRTPAEVRRLLAADNKAQPLLCFISPSGDGVKAVYRCGDNSPGTCYKWLKTRLASRYSLEIDEAATDTARSCLLCHDSGVYFNPMAEVLQIEQRAAVVPLMAAAAPRPNIKKWVLRNPHPQQERDTTQAVEELAARAVAAGVDIAPSYEQWSALAFSLCGHPDGERIFVELSSVHGTSERAARDAFKAHQRSKRSGITGGTFFYLCKQAGVTFKD